MRASQDYFGGSANCRPWKLVIRPKNRSGRNWQNRSCRQKFKVGLPTVGSNNNKNRWNKPRTMSMALILASGMSNWTISKCPSWEAKCNGVLFSYNKRLHTRTIATHNWCTHTKSCAVASAPCSMSVSTIPLFPNLANLHNRLPNKFFYQRKRFSVS